MVTSFSSSKMELRSLALSRLLVVLGDGVEEVGLRAFEHVSIGQVLLIDNARRLLDP